MYKRQDQYLLARRSLRAWPVPGPDHLANLKVFLVDKMKMDPSFFADAGDIKVEKFFDARSKNKDEVIITFRNKGVRDTVKAAARNLAAEGRAAGVRMQVPGYLISTFRLLENLGYQMKKVDPDVRRVVKFDDSKMSLMMDIRVNDSWRRVYPDDAKKAMARTPNLSAAAGPAEVSSDNISDFFTQTPASGANAEPMQ